MSSPSINNGIITGCIICYVTIFVYGLDDRFLNRDAIKYSCNVSIFHSVVEVTLKILNTVPSQMKRHSRAGILLSHNK